MTKEEMKEQCKICKRVTRKKYHLVIAWAIIATIAFAVVLTLYFAEGNIGGTTEEYDVEVCENGGDVQGVIVGNNEIQENCDIQEAIQNEKTINTIIVCITSIVCVILVGGVIIIVYKNRS